VDPIESVTFVLAVQDLRASKEFFEQKMGFSEDFSVEGWSFLSRGACNLRIGHCPDEKPAFECGDHSWFAYLHVSDASALYEEFLGRGLASMTRIEDKPWGFREFLVTTPDGHRLMFGQELQPEV
jgi:uncharacterized glyoxalase superfamily protein PhnB